ncbi:hypothetical protein CNN02315 [Cryptococcus deneoformans JEC21]|uniref:Uncharacterized protein n=1 Tax=Cryptococcus deneoformans (strain JEC21 / ATCC MYA-565) TaxID=214684 RepID=A0A0S2M682_CRYD1|nr:hypothetical protein CNN02315 [Cryptococcus neoformans var. neoformans JEC21]ALO69825.1 hypothetical protein CNN02315 [Cryptococcus neoformans var. neoformans JEC21]
MGDVYITNTWEIAEWLDEKYGFNKTLFPSEGEKTHKETHKVFLTLEQQSRSS